MSWWQFRSDLQKVRGIISRWTGYNLSFHGKITVCKTLLLSQYTYADSILDCITSKQMDLIQAQVDYFINHGKNTPKPGTEEKKDNLWIDTKTLCNDKINGGFGCINIKDFFTGHKLSWLRRYAQGSLIPAHAHTLCAGNLGQLTGNFTWKSRTFVSNFVSTGLHRKFFPQG